MKRTVFWQLGNLRLDFDQIRAGDFPAQVTPFEIEALEFGRSWLNGVNTFLLHTSGSTGTPKSIALSRSQMEASAHLTEIALGLSSGQTALLCLDPRYIAGKMMMVRSFVTGLNLVIAEPAANPLEGLNHPIDLAALVPYQMFSILNSPGTTSKLIKCKTILLGGAPVDEKLKSMMMDLPCKVYATYGMTETISHIALQRLNGAEKQDAFQTLPGISIQTDARGCLIITADYLGPQQIITQDLVEIISPHQFRWLGRVDHIINTGGVKVIPEKIERAVDVVFQLLGFKNRFFIGGTPDHRLGSKVVLFVEGDLPDEHSVATIHNKLEDHLSRFETPKEIRVVKKFVETDTQKVNRQATIYKALGLGPKPLPHSR